MQRYCVRPLLLAALAALSGACGGGGGGGGGGPIGPDDEPVATVSVTAPAGQIVPGQTKQLAVVLRAIPIDQAMRLTIERGLTSRPEPAAETPGMMPQDSSGGRTFERRRQ